MTISYNWLSEYLPKRLSPQELSVILTSVGLEVENLQIYEEFKGGMQGLVVGEVMTAEKHPGADKLKLTTVNVGNETLQIVCGAPNVAVGQKVIVAPVGSTIHPLNSEPVTMKKAKIRGEDSYGMICAADEIGLGEDHSGIFILPEDQQPGNAVSDFFKPYSDHIYEIGLTPNRMDAMSHIGVAKDIVAYLSHHDSENYSAKLPFQSSWPQGLQQPSIQVELKDDVACNRYAGIRISGIKVEKSPEWLEKRLKSIGVRSINNIVDITNFILHETGQPLHAFDANAIAGNKVIVETLTEGTKFITLDDKERELSGNDLMICNGNDEPMCIGGVFGGKQSGVTDYTTDIFLESAWFNPVSIRRSSLKHGLRTDAATRFEKGVDISMTVEVLKRAALLIAEVAGGKINEDFVDIYPKPQQKNKVGLSYKYLAKLSGKEYSKETASGILKALGFEILESSDEQLQVAVPFSKPDITIAADLVEEIMRIDGLDNVEIPQVIKVAPSVEPGAEKTFYKEKIANILTGRGFYEIFTNSITNSAYYTKNDSHVMMLNNLSNELDILRPSMLETGMASVAHNVNRQNRNLQFFEFGKTYQRLNKRFVEKEQFCVYVSGNMQESSWKNKSTGTDIYYLKGVCISIAKALNLGAITYTVGEFAGLDQAISINAGNKIIGYIGNASLTTLQKFSLKQPVFVAMFEFDVINQLQKQDITFKEIPKYPTVHRDLSVIVEKNRKWDEIEKMTRLLKLDKLKNIKLFDVFEHEKIGAGNRSLAINYTFTDYEKTLTDKETDDMMNKIINLYESELKAQVRKG